MGLLNDLNYTMTSPNRVQRTLQRVAAGERIGRLLQRSLHPIDRAVHRVSGERNTAASLLAGLPIIMLTTTGAKTGTDRTIPLMGIPVADELVVIGSNFGCITCHSTDDSEGHGPTFAGLAGSAMSTTWTPVKSSEQTMSSNVPR